jgi:hypothetical protein
MSNVKEGTIKCVKAFAWLPMNLFPQYGYNKRREFIWLRPYYKAYRWDIKTWVVNDPTLQGWTWIGNGKDIIVLGT